MQEMSKGLTTIRLNNDLGCIFMISLVLASRSTNRMRILRREGVTFEAIEAPFDDAAEAPLGVVEHNAMRIAQLKARSVMETFAPRCQGKVILAADTMCEMDGRAMGKPRSREEAAAMLRAAFRGAHRVVTGVCVVLAEREWTFFDEALVTIEAVSEEKLQTYIASDVWQGRAGGYDFADRIDHGWRVHCHGDPDTVAGLPWRRVKEFLAQAEKQFL